MAEGNGTKQIIMIFQLALVLLAAMVVAKLGSTWLRDTFAIPICCGPMPKDKAA